MNPAFVIIASSVLLALTGSLRAADAPAGPAKKPNILFILTDDQRWNALGCMGDKNVLTPNIDRIAGQGVLFQNHFVTTAICCVSRASIFSGQYERRHGIGDFKTPFKPAQWARTYPALLRKNGYRTGFIGKFGVGNEAAIKAMAAEFDYWRGLPGQGGRDFFLPNDKDHVHTTARCGDQAVEFLSGCSTQQPFCLSVSFNAPHARDHLPREFTPDDRDVSLYKDITIARPPTATDEFFHKLPKSVQTSEGRTRWGWRYDTEEKFQNNAKDYYRLISGIDREVGRMMAELEKRGLAGNTVVIFTSDNGYFMGDRGLADKWFMYEEGMRDPLIILDPRQPLADRARSESAMTLNIDFAPTMLALAGITPPAGMQGRSLVPLLEKHTPADWRTEFFYEHHYAPEIIPPSEGVRTERYAYIRWVDEDPPVEELYDLKNDPLEAHNLAADPEHASVLKQLRERRKQYLDQLK